MDCSAKGKVFILPDGWNKKRSGIVEKQEILFVCDYNVIYSTKGLLDLRMVGNWQGLV